jgi:uncharacterized protein YcbK (DUF882 family)
VITLVNVWTRERLPLMGEERPSEAVLSRFMRCRFTNQVAPVDLRLVDILRGAARKFRAARIEIVSAYRSPKHNLWLRKKGRQVARDSEHTSGAAVDFRVPDVPIRRLLRFVRSLRRGGAGYYPQSRFVHADVGPIRYWRGS